MTLRPPLIMLIAVAACLAPSCASHRSTTAATSTSLPRALSSIADDVELLPGGRFWVRERTATPRPELLVPAAGLLRWAGRIDEPTANELRSRSSQLVARESTGAVAALLVSSAGDPSAVARLRRDIEGNLPPERVGLLAPRLDAMALPAEERPAADCSPALAALGSADLEFSVRATLILAGSGGRCDAEAADMVAAFCRAPADWAIADRVLDLVALLPTHLDELRRCARDHVAALVRQLGTSPESELQLYGPVLWLADPSTAEVGSAPLLDAAQRVVDDDGRTVFPAPATSASPEDVLAVRLVLGLGLLPPAVADGLRSAVGASSVPPPPTCAAVTEDRRDVAPSEVSSGPAGLVEFLTSRTAPCSVPRPPTPTDELAALVLDGAARIAGCLTADRPGGVRPPPPGGAAAPAGFEDDRTVALLLAVRELTPRQLCAAVRQGFTT